MADVAFAANVSTASVSRALTRPDMVSDEIRLRVSRAAVTLGYVPNVAARALAGRRAGLIGVVLGDLERPGVADALTSLEERLDLAGWALIVRSCRAEAASAAHARALLHRGIDALIFLGIDVPSNFRIVVDAESLPCVSVDRIDDTGFVANAGFDLGRARRLAVDYLTQLGHRNMAVVGDSDAAAFSAGARRGADASPATVETLSSVRGSIAEGLIGRLARPHPPTAVICASDALAVGMLQACTAQGIDVPSRISVVGMGDTPLARCATPALTSLRIPTHRAGLAAADHLLARFAGRVYAVEELPVKVVVRGSTGPAR